MPGGAKCVLTDTTQNGRTESPGICGGPPLKMVPSRLEGDVCKKEVLRLKYWRLLKKKKIGDSSWAVMRKLIQESGS